MKALQTIYLALGSNKGDSFINLQNAIDNIFETVGNIISIANVYKTKAVGFNGDDFLNTCIAITTSLSPNTLLTALLDIEKKLGRTRKNSMNYESRIIDIDILFYAEELIETKDLIIPHAETHKRKFVLVPLNDIAPNFIHSKFDKAISQLVLDCEDKSIPEAINTVLKNPAHQFSISSYNHIAIEGNIGAGKTSLATKIANDFNAKLILERFEDNPYLPKFYEDPKKHAFKLEMSFLVDRYQQVSNDLSQLDLFKDFIISDYDIFKSLVFSRITLEPDEFKLYRKLFFVMYKEISTPDLYIYLYQNTEQLQANIKKRDRGFESTIDNEYLEKINAGYLSFLKSQTALNIKIIDVSNRDFVNNREDYLFILDAICAE